MEEKTLTYAEDDNLLDIVGNVVKSELSGKFYARFIIGEVATEEEAVEILNTAMELFCASKGVPIDKVKTTSH